MSCIAYSAIVLDNRSKSKILKLFKQIKPKDFEIIANHMTINLGPIDERFETYLGQTVRLKAESFSMNEKVMAIEVSGFYSYNEIPHITIAVNRKLDGKPKDSKELEEWTLINKVININNLYLTGKVTEVNYPPTLKRWDGLRVSTDVLPK